MDFFVLAVRDTFGLDHAMIGYSHWPLATLFSLASINFTLLPDGKISATPSLFGSNPVEVKHGPRKGLRALDGEETTARALADHYRHGHSH